jgi:hypothetical protein
MTKFFKENFLAVFILSCIFLTLIYHIGSYTFDIDEMILTENIEKSYNEYKNTNPSFATSLKLNHWLGERIFGEGPFAWRLSNCLSLFFLCLFLIFFFTEKSVGISITLALFLLQYPMQYANWGVFSYMLSPFLVFLGFLLNFSITEKKRYNYKTFFISFFFIFLLHLISSLSEALSYLVLLSIFFFESFLKKERKAVSFFSFLLALSFLCSLFFFLQSNNPQLLEPRTSIKYLYYPFSQKSLFIYFYTSILTLFKQSFATAVYISFLTLILSATTIILSFFLTQNEKAQKKIFILLLTWIILIILAFFLLGLLGKAPFGNIRYLRTLVWALPACAYIGISLLISHPRKKLNEFLKKRTQKEVLEYVWFFFSLIACLFIAKDTLYFKANHFQKLKNLEPAFKEDADLYLMDILHKFSFAYLNRDKKIYIMSKGYPCDNGKYWDAYGWHSCPEKRLKPEKKVLEALAEKKNKTLLLVSRGSFDEKNYPHWFQAVVKKEKFEIRKLTAYNGLFIYQLERK